VALDSQHGGKITVYFRYGMGSFTCKTVLTCRIDKATGAFAGCAGHYVAMMGGWATLVANGNPHVLFYNRRDRRSRDCAPQAQGERHPADFRLLGSRYLIESAQGPDVVGSASSIEKPYRSCSASPRFGGIATAVERWSARFPPQRAPRDDQADGAVWAAPASITPQLPWGAVLSERPAGRPASLRSRRRNRPASRRAAHH
jgi:hypothetical protein